MSSREGGTTRRAALLGLALALSGCNLRPLHGGARGQALNEDLSAIAIKESGGRAGQTLRDYLTDEINPAGLPTVPLYTLEIGLKEAKNALAIQLNDVATRYDLSLAATFELKRKADGKTLYRSATRRVASYNVRGEPFATLIAEQDAERRAAREIARQIRTQLSLYFAKAGA